MYDNVDKMITVYILKMWESIFSQYYILTLLSRWVKKGSAPLEKEERLGVYFSWRVLYLIAVGWMSLCSKVLSIKTNKQKKKNMYRRCCVCDFLPPPSKTRQDEVKKKHHIRNVRISTQCVVGLISSINLFRRGKKKKTYRMNHIRNIHLRDLTPHSV